jgi:hypothetical protein
VDPSTDDNPSFRHRTKGNRNEITDGGKDDRCIEWLRRRLVRTTGPFRAERFGELLRFSIPWPSESVDPPTLVASDLRDDVRGGAEAVEPDPLGITRHPKRSITDEPGAKERRGVNLRVACGQWYHEAVVGDGILCVSAVPIIARELCPIAEVLLSSQTKATSLARPTEPWNADAESGLERPTTFANVDHRPSDLMPQDERQLGPIELAL